jgi:uncharacterized protein DUF3489
VYEILQETSGHLAATGWQAHTCRGAFAGALKKKRGPRRQVSA